MKILLINTGWLADSGKLSCFIQDMPAAVTAKISSAKNQARKREIASGYFLLCKASEMFGMPVYGKNPDVGIHGKPYICGGPEYNISHCEDVVVCVCDRKPIGIDIQKISSYKRGVARKMFTENEQKRVENKDVKFTLLWSLKEAYGKMTGEGLSEKTAMTDFSSLLKEEAYENESFHGTFFTVRKAGDFLITVCSAQREKMEFVIY